MIPKLLKGLIGFLEFLCLAGLMAGLGGCLSSRPMVLSTPAGFEITPSLSGRAASATAEMVSATPENRQIEVDFADLRGQVIRFWHIWQGPAGEAIQEMVDRFNVENEWGIVIVPVGFATLDELSEEITLGLEAGELPDLAMGSLHQALGWREVEQLVDLNDYVNDPVWGLTLAERADLYSSIWDLNVVGGQRLGLPAQPSARLLFYNSSWARSLGFSSPPASPEEFTEQACAAVRANREDDELANDGTGGWIISTHYSTILNWIYAFDGFVYSTPRDGEKGGYNFDAPEVEQTFTFLKGLFDQGCAWLTESQYPEAEFSNRLGLFASGSLMDVPYQQEAFRAAGNSDQWTVIPFPTEADNVRLSVHGASFFMFTSSKERQLATWLFLKWLTSPSHHARLVEATGCFPLWASEANYLQSYGNQHPQWAAALDFISLAYPEPPFTSWGTVRWALSDAASQLFRSYFALDKLPDLMEHLDWTASQLHSQTFELGGTATLESIIPKTASPTELAPRTVTPSP